MQILFKRLTQLRLPGLMLTLILGVGLAGCAHQSSSGSTNNNADSNALANATMSSTLERKIEWQLVAAENFEAIKFPTAANWQSNQLQEADYYADNGEFFRKNNPKFTLPQSYRMSYQFGQNGWLTLESYTRKSDTTFLTLASIVSDPANDLTGANNKVLRIASPRHTDGTVVRPTQALPSEYRICVSGGFADFGTGYLEPGNNGYTGGEQAEPWLEESAVVENGFYWLSILSDVPKPRNNIWIHHHRKAVIDSDNNYFAASDGGPFTHIWDGLKFKQSGEHPITMFVFDRNFSSSSSGFDFTGPPFISFANQQWNYQANDHKIRSVDSYREQQWYDSCIEKTNEYYLLSMTGKFRYGGVTSYQAKIERSKIYEPAATPDYFMFGDPHINYYEGSAYFDNIRLYVPHAK